MGNFNRNISGNNIPFLLGRNKIVNRKISDYETTSMKGLHDRYPPPPKKEKEEEKGEGGGEGKRAKEKKNIAKKTYSSGALS